MIYNHSRLNYPDNDQIIWRYLSLSKFLDLLNRSELYFARSDKFNDSMEGSMTNKDEQIFEQYAEGLSTQVKNISGAAYINCWTKSDVELYLMWNTYSSLKEGISIKTTVKNLTESFDKNDDREICISDVQYIDYNKSWTFNKTNGVANLIAPHFSKREYFHQEQEIRLVYKDYRINKESGPICQYFKVDLQKLISEVFVSPLSEDWFYELIKNEMILHGLESKKISKSSIT